MIVAQSLTEIWSSMTRLGHTILVWWRVQNQSLWVTGAAVLLIWFLIWRRPTRRY